VDRIHRVISPQSAADEKAILMIVNLTVTGIIWAKASACSASIDRSQDRQAAQRAPLFALKPFVRERRLIQLRCTTMPAMRRAPYGTARVASHQAAAADSVSSRWAFCRSR
jgi:hypothetical protein